LFLGLQDEDARVHVELSKEPKSLMKLFTVLLTIQRYADIHVLLMMKSIMIDRRRKQKKYGIITRLITCNCQEKQEITTNSNHLQIGR
jgi:hypothetical protein